MPIPQFTINSDQGDPYKQFRFRLKWDGRIVAGFSRVHGLSRPTAVVTHRSGGDPSGVRHLPGQSEFDAVTLERGVTCDGDFAAWANKIWTYDPAASGHEASLADFRKDVAIQLFNDAGQIVLAYDVLSMLAVGVFRDARTRWQRQRRGDPDPGAAERGLERDASAEEAAGQGRGRRHIAGRSAGQRPPLSCRTSPPQVGRSAGRVDFASRPTMQEWRGDNDSQSPHLRGRCPAGQRGAT